MHIHINMHMQHRDQQLLISTICINNNDISICIWDCLSIYIYIWVKGKWQPRASSASALNLNLATCIKWWICIPHQKEKSLNYSERGSPWWNSPWNSWGLPHEVLSHLVWVRQGVKTPLAFPWLLKKVKELMMAVMSLRDQRESPLTNPEAHQCQLGILL